MARGAPRLPGPSERGKGGDYELLHVAQQQISHLQAFSARLQEQVRHLQALLDRSERGTEDVRRDAELKAGQADTVRRWLPLLRDRLAKLKPQESEVSGPEQARRLALELDKLCSRLGELARAHDARLAVERGQEPAAGEPTRQDLIDLEDPFSDLDEEAGDAGAAATAEGSPAEASAPAPVVEAVVPVPGAAAAPPPAELPKPAESREKSAELEYALLELRKLRKQQFVGLGAALAAGALAVGLGFRGRAPAPAPPSPAAPARQDARAAQVPRSVEDRALALVRDRPSSRYGTLGKRLEALSPAGSAPEEGRWRVSSCAAEACDVAYSAGIVDPATGVELRYRFRADLSAKDVRGLNDPARIILR